MLKKYWKIVFLFLVLLLMLSGCKWFNPYEPDNTDPTPETYADFWIEYVRPVGSIIDPTAPAPPYLWFITTYQSGEETLKNEIILENKDGKLVGELNHVVCHTKYDERIFDFFIPDRKRQDNSNVFTIPVKVFGDIIYLVNKQTGARCQLTQVIDFGLGNHYRYTYAEGSTLVRCRIIHDSSIPESILQ